MAFGGHLKHFLDLILTETKDSILTSSKLVSTTTHAQQEHCTCVVLRLSTDFFLASSHNPGSDARSQNSQHWRQVKSIKTRRAKRGNATIDEHSFFEEKWLNGRTATNGYMRRGRVSTSKTKLGRGTSLGKNTSSITWSLISIQTHLGRMNCLPERKARTEYLLLCNSNVLWILYSEKQKPQRWCPVNS